MTSVISIAVGKCGISIQEQQWKTLLEEQGLDYSGMAKTQKSEQNLKAYFNEVKENIYKPKTLLADLDDKVINTLECGKLKQLFMGAPSVTSKLGSFNTYARGYHGVGGELKEEIENNLRQLSEQCDKLDSIQMQRSICGGTGSGFGSIVLHIAENVFDCRRIINSLIHFPEEEEDVSEQTVDIYNMVLGNQSLLDYSDLVLPFCNNNIQSLLDNSISLSRKKDYEDINCLISQIHPNMTCSLRYSGSINASTRKICTNIIPFPNQKYMTLSYLPFNYYKPLSSQNIQYKDMINSSLDKKYFLFNKRIPKILCAHHIFRGTDIYEEEIEREVFQKYQQTSVKTTSWIQNSYSIQYCNHPTLHNNKSLLSIINNRIISINLKKYGEKFTKMFDKRAFLHYYLQEGMEEWEFNEAQSYLYDLISEYIQFGYDTDDYQDYESEEAEEEQQEFELII